MELVSTNSTGSTSFFSKTLYVVRSPVAGSRAPFRVVSKGRAQISCSPARLFRKHPTTRVHHVPCHFPSQHSQHSRSNPGSAQRVRNEGGSDAAFSVSLCLLVLVYHHLVRLVVPSRCWRYHLLTFPCVKHRKKSDAPRPSPIVYNNSLLPSSSQAERPPELPSPSHFRTSPILPE